MNRISYIVGGPATIQSGVHSVGNAEPYCERVTDSLTYGIACRKWQATNKRKGATVLCETGKGNC